MTGSEEDPVTASVICVIAPVEESQTKISADPSAFFPARFAVERKATTARETRLFSVADPTRK
jgi:hypothetical protein